MIVVVESTSAELTIATNASACAWIGLLRPYTFNQQDPGICGTKRSFGCVSYARVSSIVSSRSRLKVGDTKVSSCPIQRAVSYVL